jgi:hypothetical protein
LAGLEITIATVQIAAHPDFLRATSDDEQSEQKEWSAALESFHSVIINYPFSVVSINSDFASSVTNTQDASSKTDSKLNT